MRVQLLLAVGKVVAHLFLRLFYFDFEEVVHGGVAMVGGLDGADGS